MKIGIYDPYLDTLGGGEKYMLTLTSCLSKKHDVFLFWSNNEDYIKKTAMERFSIDLSKTTFVTNIFSSNVSFLERVRKAAEYDLIIYLSDGSIPLFVTKNLIIHFQFPVVWVKQSFLTKIKLSRVKDIICNSKFTKSYIDKKFQIQSKVIYPPVDFLQNGNVIKENVILHVGRFGVSREGVNYKKQDIMISAFKHMVQKGFSGWRFIMVISVRDQDKEKSSKLKELAKGYQIEIIENPSHEELAKLYCQAKIYWHASGFGEDIEKYPEKTEHFGIATAEAMGAGAVPVVINAGGQPEIVEDGESGFLWKTLEELENKTARLAKDESLIKKMAKSAKERSKIFSGERFCHEIEKLVNI